MATKLTTLIVPAESADRWQAVLEEASAEIWNLDSPRNIVLERLREMRFELAILQSTQARSEDDK